MGDVLPFRKPPGKPGPSGKPKASRKGMCQHGFHKWEVCKEGRFDVKQGRLVTVYRCSRCGKEKVTAH